jgi:CHAT domain-containing protein
VTALLRAGREAEAFEIADASRGRALIDHLANARDAARRGAAGGDLAERDRLLRRIDALLTRLESVQARPRQERAPDDEATSRELAERLGQARAEFEAVMVRIAERAPARAALIGVGHMSLSSIREALRPDETLLHYFVTTDRLIVFAVNDAGIRSFEVTLPVAELENRVRLSRGLIASTNRPDSASVVLEELYRILIEPVEQAHMLDRARQLVIVPHGILSYLPFAALRNPATGRRVVEDRSLQFLPTAAALPSLRATLTNRFGRSRTAVFEPLPDELPATRQEASAVIAVVTEGRRLSGRAATEAALRRALAGGDVVHVATHGNMNSTNPMFSSLRLGRGRGTPEDDGRLEVHELLGMLSASPLVFLSGCETGVGGARATPFDRHEDYATLAQAFLYAGTRAVVATLWRIDDEGAAHFAERFYRHLATQPAPAALASAQRDLMRSSRWGHPYYWAAYTIAGDGLDAAGASRAASSVSR